MNTCELQEIFEVSYGTKLDYNKMNAVDSHDDDTVNFVSRTSKNGGVSAIVKIKSSIEPLEAGNITVTLGGTYLLASFLQLKPFYTAQNVAVLKPKTEMTTQEKIYYCLCITKNRYRYSAFGREANRTLKNIHIPSAIPDWVNGKEIKLNISSSPNKGSLEKFNLMDWKYFLLGDLFEIKKGKRLTKANMTEGDTPFVGAINNNNGVSTYIGQEPIFDAGTLTVNYDGNGVAEAYYQQKPYWALDSVNVLYPNFKINSYIAMFLITVIRKEKFRFSYGRKWHMQRMKESVVKLPSDVSGNPDWSYMESYIKGLQYGDKI